jgi:uncharacterized integral membrane protein
MDGLPTPGRPEIAPMTDPTTRYPLPDDPGSDPLAAPGPAPTPPPSTESAATALGPATAPNGPATGHPSTPTSDATPGSAPAVVESSTASASAPPATAWTAPKGRESRWPAVLFGAILIVIGLWFFAEVTLGLELPTIRWGQLWPLILIIVGGLILYGSRLGRSR